MKPGRPRVCAECGIARGVAQNIAAHHLKQRGVKLPAPEQRLPNQE